jgi:hypothetical protein
LPYEVAFERTLKLYRNILGYDWELDMPPWLDFKFDPAEFRASDQNRSANESYAVKMEDVWTVLKAEKALA